MYKSVGVCIDHISTLHLSTTGIHALVENVKANILKWILYQSGSVLWQLNLKSSEFRAV